MWHARTQVEVVHGGFVQHDEGLSSVADVIDMMELGLRYVESLLGTKTRIAWQIDSFGHTASTPVCGGGGVGGDGGREKGRGGEKRSVGLCLSVYVWV